MRDQIDRRPASSALPLYIQLSEVLIREIAAGRLPDGSRLPPERMLAAQYQTTVRTLRKSLDILEEKGLLRRVQGSGNYVQSSAQISSIYSMFRLELRTGGGLPSAQVLAVDYLAKPADLPRFGTASHATRIRRLRFLNSLPVAVEEIWLDGAAGRLEAEKLSDSLYLTYRVQLGLRILQAEDYVSIAPIPDWVPLEFARPATSPAPFVERYSHADGRGIIEYSRNWIDHTRAHYVQRLK